MTKPHVQWFARGGGVAQCGSFSSQIEAANAMRLITESDEDYRRYLVNVRGTPRPQLRGGFPADVFVWPEVTPAVRVRQATSTRSRTRTGVPHRVGT